MLIFIVENGHYYVVDKNSTNHTYVNDEMITSNIKVEIKDGDVIRLANEKFAFKTRQAREDNMDFIVSGATDIGNVKKTNQDVISVKVISNTYGKDGLCNCL